MFSKTNNETSIKNIQYNSFNNCTGEINYTFYMKLVAGLFYMTKVTNRSKYHLHMKTLYDDKTEEEFNEQKHFIFVQSERDIFTK